VQRGGHVFPRAAVERGSFDHDAFRIPVEIHTRINQAKAGRLRWWRGVGKKSAVIRDCLGGSA
jgi:hypothetical protein